MWKNKTHLSLTEGGKDIGGSERDQTEESAEKKILARSQAPRGVRLVTRTGNQTPDLGVVEGVLGKSLELASSPRREGNLKVKKNNAAEGTQEYQSSTSKEGGKRVGI